MCGTLTTPDDVDYLYGGNYYCWRCPDYMSPIASKDEYVDCRCDEESVPCCGDGEVNCTSWGCGNSECVRCPHGALALKSLSPGPARGAQMFFLFVVCFCLSLFLCFCLSLCSNGFILVLKYTNYTMAPKNEPGPKDRYVSISKCFFFFFFFYKNKVDLGRYLLEADPNISKLLASPSYFRC